MSRKYRLNVRFDLDNEAERSAVDYLNSLDASRNAFIVNAVLAHMEGSTLLDSIRQIVREELASISVTAPAQPKSATIDAAMTAEEEAENAESVLAALDMFL